MKSPAPTTGSVEPAFLAAVDAAVLGTALVYEKHRTGVHRVVKELLEEFKKRPDVRLEFLSSGRAAWLEFPTRLAFEKHWKRDGWVFRSRRARVPGTSGLLTMLARGLLAAGDRKWISEKVVVGGLQVLGHGLRPRLASFSAPVYWSPAHALPRVPNGVRRCITLYDMIPAKFPAWYDETRSFQAILASIDPQRDTVIAISECTRRDWLEHSHGDTALARVTTLGVSDLFTPHDAGSSERERVRASYGIGDSAFLLAVGTLEPRKNLDTLIRAFVRLRGNGRHAGLKLLLVGPRGWKNDALFALLQAHPDIAQDIRLTGFVPDEDLPGLYSACEVFVYPSRYEGFGFPVAEAMKCGAVVACGANSSLPEVAGDAAAYVDIEDASSLAQAISTLLDDKPRRDSLKRKALERSALFDWTPVADAYLDIFAGSAGASHPRDLRARSSIKA